MPSNECSTCGTALTEKERLAGRCPVCDGPSGGGRTDGEREIRPLGDPLFAARKWMLGASAVLVVLLVASTLIAWSLEGPDVLRTAGGVALTGAPWMLLWLIILPRRPTNVLYLRAFANDRESFPVRIALQRALGREFRVSGIRDPRRRKSLIDLFARTGALFRYASPKFMNLEAGVDWKQRLWRSMCDTRFVALDLRTITDAVREEVELSLVTVGVERCLFVVDETRTPEEWRAAIAEMAPQGTAAGARLVNWSGATPEPAFAAGLREFVSELPPGTPDVDPDSRFVALTCPVDTSLAPPAYSEVDHRDQAVLIGVALLGACFAANGGGELFGNLLQRLAIAVTLSQALLYAVDCGSPRKGLLVVSLTAWAGYGYVLASG